MFFHVKYVYDWLKPGLREQRHHRGTGERLREEDRLGVLASHLRDHPLPERNGLRVRVVDPVGADAACAPGEQDVAKGVPERLPLGALPVDVVDVLIALGRVLGVLQRAVGAVLEPLRVLGQPGVVGRHLDREVQRDLEAVLACRGDERPRTRPSCPAPAWMASCPPSAAPIAHGLPGSPGCRPLGVVAALAVRAADRVDRRQVDDVEAELGELGKRLGDAAEAAPRAREELVPRAEARTLSLDVELERFGRLGCVAAPLRLRGRAPSSATPRPSRRPNSSLALGELARRGRPARQRACGRTRRASSRTGRARPGRGTPSGRASSGSSQHSKRSLPTGSSGVSRQPRAPAGR